eukprot:g20607.t1
MILDSRQVEVEVSFRDMKDGNVAGVDGIPMEIFQLGGAQRIHHLHPLFLSLGQRRNPADLRDAIALSSRKETKWTVGTINSLFAVTGKIIAQFLSICLLPVSEEILPESLCVFRANCGTMDMIFTDQQLKAKCQEQHKPLVINYPLKASTGLRAC